MTRKDGGPERPGTLTRWRERINTTAGTIAVLLGLLGSVGTGVVWAASQVFAGETSNRGAHEKIVRDQVEVDKAQDKRLAESKADCERRTAEAAAAQTTALGQVKVELETVQQQQGETRTDLRWIRGTLRALARRQGVVPEYEPEPEGPEEP